MLELICILSGWIGMVLILVGVVVANRGSKKLYNQLAIIGGVCLTLNSWYIGSAPFFILNVVYSLLGVWGLIKND